MSQRLLKLAASLQHKKYRDKEQLFLAEGTKLVLSLLENGYTPMSILCTESWAENHHVAQLSIIDAKALKKVSSLKTISDVIGLFHMPNSQQIEIKDNSPILILERIQDPGNLGTIIRTAAWFGIKNIFCSPDTVDCYNSKVIQATMGAIGLVQIHYTPLLPLVKSLKAKGRTIYGTFLDGKNIYESSLSQNIAVIIGNEGSGISQELENCITKAITIPAGASPHPESLNASISTAIICSEIFRRNMQKV